jgi:hypothetical protein
MKGSARASGFSGSTCPVVLFAHQIKPFCHGDLISPTRKQGSCYRDGLFSAVIPAVFCLPISPYHLGAIVIPKCMIHFYRFSPHDMRRM